jgi:hypothetical protein
LATETYSGLFMKCGRLGPFASKTGFRRPAKRRCGDVLQQARGPTTSPHAGLGAFAAFFRLSQARPAPDGFLRERANSVRSVHE